MAANRFRVPKRQWRKWCDLSQRVFNQMYERIKQSGTMLAPSLDRMTPRQTRILAWNAAWLAASDTEDSLKAIARGT